MNALSYRIARRRMGWSQRAMASRLGCHQSTISRAEKRGKLLRPGDQKLLEDLLGGEAGGSKHCQSPSYYSAVILSANAGDV